MEPRPRRSVGLIIRRFFALFILFSTISGVVSAVETNSFNDDVIGGLFVSLLIVYYLARSPRRNRSRTEAEIEDNNNFEDDTDFEMEELIEEFEESFEEMDSEEVQTNYKPESVKKNNPVRDNQSILSRIFQGRTDRY